MTLVPHARSYRDRLTSVGIGWEVLAEPSWAYHEAGNVALHRLITSGYRVHVVAADRAPVAEVEVRLWEWKAAHSSVLPFDEAIHVTGFFLTSDVGQYEQLREAGVVSILLHRPWNLDAPDEAGVIVRRDRVATVGEFAERVLWGPAPPYAPPPGPDLSVDDLQTEP